MTDQEIFKLALDCLENAVDLQQSEIDDHITKYGEWYRPERVEFMREYLNKTNQSIEAIRARLARPEPSTYNSFGLMGGDKFVSKDSVDRDIV